MLAQLAQLAQIYDLWFTINGLRPCQQANPVWHRWHEALLCGASRLDVVLGARMLVTCKQATPASINLGQASMDPDTSPASITPA
tara:strand:- start:3517 stop:3771 length:255 start_codon:yes stop_codon:yes gene_type:complete